MLWFKPYNISLLNLKQFPKNNDFELVKGRQDENHKWQTSSLKLYISLLINSPYKTSLLWIPLVFRPSTLPNNTRFSYPVFPAASLITNFTQVLQNRISQLTREPNRMASLIASFGGLECIGVPATSPVDELQASVSHGVEVEHREVATTHAWIWRLGATLCRTARGWHEWREMEGKVMVGDYMKKWRYWEGIWGRMKKRWWW